jgi:hypothetical protein
MPEVNIEAMNEHLAVISRCVSVGAIAVLVLDNAGWHTPPRLKLPDNIVLLPLPPYAPVPTSWQHNAAHHHDQADWIRISAIRHAAWGQVCRVSRRFTRHGEAYLLVELPDGQQERIPQSWTEDLNNGGSAMPALLFSPSSLRALVRLVRQHGRAPAAENGHVPHTPDLEPATCGDADRNGQTLGRIAAPTHDTRRVHAGKNAS